MPGAQYCQIYTAFISSAVIDHLEDKATIFAVRWAQLVVVDP